MEAADRRTAALLVDAGYLLSMMAEVLTGDAEAKRSCVQLRERGDALISYLQDEVQKAGLTLLRTYYYDGATDLCPNQTQRHIGQKAHVKLRLGDLVFGKQKGVDKLISCDLLSLAMNKAVTDIVLISGDQDVADEFDAAGQHGIVMHLWFLRGCDEDAKVSDHLVRAADEWRSLSQDDVASYAMTALDRREKGAFFGAAAE